MGRPKLKEPRTQQLNLSFTSDELERIRGRASALGMRTSQFGRTVLLVTPRQAASVPSGRSNADRLVRQQLSRLGNNLNQLVRHLHQTGEPLPADLEPLLKDIREIIARL